MYIVKQLTKNFTFEMQADFNPRPVCVYISAEIMLNLFTDHRGVRFSIHVLWFSAEISLCDNRHADEY